jgi:hypothetical protein
VKPSDVSFGRFFLRIAACHTVTYMVVGLAAFHLMDYTTEFSREGSNMVPTAEPIVALGPALQVFRGLLFAVVLYPFRRVFLDEPTGWLKLWGLFLGLAILGTSGPAPGSFEGLIFTRTPVVAQIVGLWEAVLQTLFASILLVAWHRRPRKAWGIVMYSLWALTIVMSLAGALLPRAGQ